MFCTRGNNLDKFDYLTSLKFLANGEVFSLTSRRLVYLITELKKALLKILVLSPSHGFVLVLGR